MLKNSLSLLAVIALGISFVGCGGGSSSSYTSADTTSTGIFADAPVKGLSYKTATQSGFTDAQGHFKYKAGETVEFKLGTLSLGSCKAGAFVTPYTLGDSNISVPSLKTKNIAMLLQSLDANRSNSSILDISKLKDFNFSSVAIDLTSTNMGTNVIPNIVSAITTDASFGPSYLDSNTTPISSTSAMDSLKQYVINNSIKYDKKFTKAYLDGKTLYSVFKGESGVSVYDFSSANANKTFVDSNPGSDYGKTFTGAYFTGGNDEGMIRIVNGELWDYLYTSNNNTPVYNDGINKFKIVSVDDTKITTTMTVYPDGDVYTAYFYFSHP